MRLCKQNRQPKSFIRLPMQALFPMLTPLFTGFQGYYQPLDPLKQHAGRERQNDDRFHLRLLSFGGGLRAGSINQPRIEGRDGV